MKLTTEPTKQVDSKSIISSQIKKLGATRHCKGALLIEERGTSDGWAITNPTTAKQNGKTHLTLVTRTRKNDSIVRMANHLHVNPLGLLQNVKFIIPGIRVLVTFALDLPTETQYPIILIRPCLRATNIAHN